MLRTECVWPCTKFILIINSYFILTGTKFLIQDHKIDIFIPTPSILSKRLHQSFNSNLNQNIN